MTLRKVTRIMILAGVLLLGIATAIGKQSGKGDPRRAEARYYFLRGTVYEAQDEYDKAFEYYKKAYETDTSYTDAAYAFGNYRFVLSIDTMGSPEEVQRSLELLKKHYDANPNDIETAETYAYYAAQADSVPLEAIRVYKDLIKRNPDKSDLYASIAALYVDAGDLESALQALEEYERLEGADSETMLQKVSYGMALGDTLKILEIAKNYYEERPDDEEAIVVRAMIFSYVDMPDSSLFVLEKGVRDYPEKGGLKFMLADRYLEDGDTVSFHKLIGEAFKSQDMNFDDKMKILNSYIYDIDYDGGNYEESDKLFKYAASLYSSDPSFLEIYARYEMFKGNFEKSYEIVKKNFMLEPDNASYLGTLMTYSILADKQEEGIAAYENFPDPDINTEYDKVLLYVTVLQSAEKYDKAVEWTDTLLHTVTPSLNISMTLTEEDVDSLWGEYDYYDLYSASAVYEIAGDLYAKLGKSEDVLRNYENSLLLSGASNASLLNNYAYYLIDTMDADPGTEEFDKAKEMSWQSLELTDYNPQGNYYDTYAWILFLDADHKEALEYIETAFDLLDESEYNAELHAHYGDILFMNGHPAEALEQWKKAYEFEQDYPLIQKKIKYKTFFYE